MKKLIYGLALAVVALTSCTTWDDENPQSFGAGPSVAINVTTTTDSAFTFTVTPENTAQYYSYVVAEGGAEALDSSSLLKGNYSGLEGSVIEYASTPSLTSNMRDASGTPLCSPNTTYTIYAVAADADGIIGHVATATVTTSDGNAPTFEEFQPGNDGSATATFSEAVAQGAGAVTAVYYKINDISNPVTIDSVGVSIDGSNVTLSADVPAGAYVLYSWEEGAFVDSYGNPCPALNSSLNMTTGNFDGVWARKATENWTIADSTFTAPEVGSLVADYSSFTGTITFDKDVYQGLNDEGEVEDGLITLTYTGSSKSTTVKLSADDWSASGNTVTFKMPEAAAAGDIITVNIAAGAIEDVYGNPNSAYSSTDETVWWKYFAATKDMIIGTFSFTYYSAYDETPTLYNGGTISINEDNSRDNGIVINNLFGNGGSAEATYDLNTGKVYIPAWTVIGYMEYAGYTWEMDAYPTDGNENGVEFTINPDGTITSSNFGVLIYNEEYNATSSYWYEKCSSAILTKSNASAKAKRVAAKAKKIKKNSHKLRKANVKRHR